MARNASSLLDLRLEQAREMYVKSPSPLSLEECAERVQLKISTVQKAAALDRWVVLRDQYQQQMIKEMAETMLPDYRDKLRRLMDKKLEIMRVTLEKAFEYVDSEDFHFSKPEQLAEVLKNMNKSVETLSKVANPASVIQPNVIDRNLRANNDGQVLVGLFGMMFPANAMRQAGTIDMGDDGDAVA